MAVITISRQIGAGAWVLGRRLATRIGYHYIDEAMIKEVAEEVGVTKQDIRAFEKEGATKLMRFLDRVVSKDFIHRHIADKYGYVDEERYVEVVTAIIKRLHGQGNVVIVGRAGQFILKDYPEVWRVLLVNELRNRIKFVMSNYNMTEEQAARFIAERDRIRTNFLSFFAKRELHDDPRVYDLAINMQKVNMDKAEQLILSLISY